MSLDHLNDFGVTECSFTILHLNDFFNVESQISLVFLLQLSEVLRVDSVDVEQHLTFVLLHSVLTSFDAPDKLYCFQFQSLERTKGERIGDFVFRRHLMQTSSGCIALIL